RQVERTYMILPNIISIVPATGTVGTIVTVRGNGFGTSNAIRLAFGVNSTITNTTAQINGSFTAIFTIDTQVCGITVITAHDSITNAQGTLTILPNFYQYTPKSGTVGTTVIVNGNGFGQGEDIRVTFGNTTTITTAVTSGSGSFTSSFSVDLQHYGTTSVSATGLTSGRAFEDVFNISSVITNMTPTIGSVTTQVTISGNGFGASENIKISYGNRTTMTTVIGETTTDGNGSFTTTFTLDTQVYGTRSVIAAGLDSGRADSRLLKLVARLWQVSPTTGTVGSRITVYGDGYADSEGIQINFKGNVVNTTIPAQITTSGNGTYSASFEVTVQTAGTTTVSAVSTVPNKSFQTAENTFWISSQITGVIPTQGPVGTSVTVTGTGYSGAESVRIAFGINQTITSVTTSGYGTFSTIFTVDTQGIGTTTITAIGSITSDDDIFVIRTGIASIVPTTGTVGMQVVITGGGYKAYELVRIDLGQTTTISTCTANGSGWIQGTFTVDEQCYGSKTVTATGMDSQSYGTTIFKITQHLVSVSPTEGTVGTVITVYGNGYTQGNMTISFGDKTAITNGPANSNGTFSIPFTIDIQPYGTTIVTANDSAAYSDSAVVIIKSHIVSVTPQVGSVGTKVTVTGDGYGASESIRILLGNTPTITTTTSSKCGLFSTTFTVDIQASGTVSVTAYGKQDENNHVDDDQFRIRGEITLVSPTQGTVGTPITVNGNGYGSGEDVRIDFGLADGITSTTALGNGVFSVVFTIDTQVYGTKTLTASGITTGDVTIRKVKVVPQVVTVAPIRGTIGTIITIYGTGYEPAVIMQIDIGTAVGTGYGSDTIQSQIETSGRGTFTAYVWTNICQTYGTTTITAYRLENNVSATNTYFILPEVWSVKPTSGVVGTIVTVTGSGYKANDVVKLQFGSSVSIATGTILANGSFTVSFTVDTQVYGTTTIRGYCGNMTDDSSNIFKILPKIYRVSPVTGTVGSG
ncbi:hypothetical protein KKG56_12315, partial [bacterium]|nr:hypothetical protein [bacterium]